MAWVRVSCQTMALWMGSPVALSQMTVVSRWLVMPTAAIEEASRSARASAPPQTWRVLTQISAASCSTHPALGKICWCSSWSTATTWPEWSKIMQRVDVVPWSIAATYWVMRAAPWRVGRTVGRCRRVVAAGGQPAVLTGAIDGDEGGERRRR